MPDVFGIVPLRFKFTALSVRFHVAPGYDKKKKNDTVAKYKLYVCKGKSIGEVKGTNEMEFHVGACLVSRNRKFG